MKVSIKTTVIIAIVAVAAICGAGLVVAMADNNNEYKITYILNGGTNSDLNPTSYTSGETHVLLDAVSDELYFYSWYMDEDLTRSIGTITSDMSGDLTLYAKWTDNLEGKGFTLTMSGYVQRGFFTEYELSGTTTYE